MPVPRLEDYGISPVSGFLPEELPLEQLPAYFGPWESIVQDLPALILTKRVREFIDGMPYLHAGKLRGVEQQRRAASVLGFMAHAYVWSPPGPKETLPPQLAEPLLIVNRELGLPPLATYAGLCLWNFRTVVPCKSHADWNLESLATMITYTGSSDESWFYLVSVALERQGGPCLDNGLKALHAIEAYDVSTAVSRLQRLAGDIDGLSTIMMRMSESLDPQFFFNRMRPYLAGWRGMEKAGLPRGVFYGTEKEPRQYAGGSNGQSSLIQALDIILNVEHFGMGERKPPSVMRVHPEEPEDHPHTGKAKNSSNSFLTEMREYMPREHRQFLVDLEKSVKLRPFVIENRERYPELADAYDRCLMSLRTFRSKHIQIVMRYISMQARCKSEGVGLARSKGEVGTGGTDLIPFLKQARDEVDDAAAGNWSRSILTSVDSPPRRDAP